MTRITQYLKCCTPVNAVNHHKLSFFNICNGAWTAAEMHQFEQLPKHFSYKALLRALRRENVSLINLYFLLSMCVNKQFMYHNFIVIIFLYYIFCIKISFCSFM